jgi:hypothetical protein
VISSIICARLSKSNISPLLTARPRLISTTGCQNARNQEFGAPRSTIDWGINVMVIDSCNYKLVMSRMSCFGITSMSRTALGYARKISFTDFYIRITMTLPSQTQAHPQNPCYFVRVFSFLFFWQRCKRARRVDHLRDDVTYSRPMIILDFEVGFKFGSGGKVCWKNAITQSYLGRVVLFWKGWVYCCLKYVIFNLTKFDQQGTWKMAT